MLRDAMILSSALLAMLGAPSCGSKEGEASGASTPSSASTPNAMNAAAANGLATLDASKGVAEQWTLEEGGPTQFLFFAQQAFKLSASCKKPDGKLDCAAFTQIKSGMPTEVPKRELDGRMSAGTKVCLKMKNQVTTGRNALGSEDGFCRFPDGSLITVGALEQYSLRIIQ